MFFLLFFSLFSSRENGKDTNGKVSFQDPEESPLPWKRSLRREIIHTYKPKCTMATLHDDTAKLGGDVYDISDSDDDRENQLTALQSHADVQARQKPLKTDDAKKKGKAPQKKKRKMKETDPSKKWNPEGDKPNQDSTPQKDNISLSLDKTLSDSDEDRDRQLLSLQGNVLSSETKKKRKTRSSPRLASAKKRRGGKAADAGQRTITSMFRQIEAFPKKETQKETDVEQSEEEFCDPEPEPAVSQTDDDNISHDEEPTPMDDEIQNEDLSETEDVDSFKLPQSSSQVKPTKAESSTTAATPVNSQSAANFVKKLTTPSAESKSVSDLTTPAMPESLLTAVIKKATKVPRKKKQSPQNPDLLTSGGTVESEKLSTTRVEAKRARRSLEVDNKNILQVNKTTSQRRTRSMSHPVVSESPLAQPFSLDKGQKSVKKRESPRNKPDLDEQMNCSQDEQMMTDELLKSPPAKSTRSFSRLSDKSHSDSPDAVENQKPDKVRSMDKRQDPEAKTRNAQNDKSQKIKGNSLDIDSHEEQDKNRSDSERNNDHDIFAADSTTGIEGDGMENPFEDSLSIFPTVKTYTVAKSCSSDVPKILMTPDRVKRSREETLHRASLVSPRSNVRRAPLTPIVRRSRGRSAGSPPEADIPVFKTPQAIPARSRIAKRKSASPMVSQAENIEESDNEIDFGLTNVVDSQITEELVKENNVEAIKTASPKVSMGKGFKVTSFYNRPPKIADGVDKRTQKAGTTKQTTLKDFVTKKESKIKPPTKPASPEKESRSKRKHIQKEKTQIKMVRPKDQEDCDRESAHGEDDKYQEETAKELEEMEEREIDKDGAQCNSQAEGLEEEGRTSKQKSKQYNKKRCSTNQKVLGRQMDEEEQTCVEDPEDTHDDLEPISPLNRSDIEALISAPVKTKPERKPKQRAKTQETTRPSPRQSPRLRKTTFDKEKPSQSQSVRNVNEDLETDNSPKKDDLPTDLPKSTTRRKSQRKTVQQTKQQKQLKSAKVTTTEEGSSDRNGGCRNEESVEDVVNDLGPTESEDQPGSVDALIQMSKFDFLATNNV